MKTAINNENAHPNLQQMKKSDPIKANHRIKRAPAVNGSALRKRSHSYAHDPRNDVVQSNRKRRPTYHEPAAFSADIPDTSAIGAQQSRKSQQYQQPQKKQKQSKSPVQEKRTKRRKSSTSSQPEGVYSPVPKSQILDEVNESFNGSASAPPAAFEDDRESPASAKQNQALSVSAAVGTPFAQSPISRNTGQDRSESANSERKEHKEESPEIESDAAEKEENQSWITSGKRRLMKLTAMKFFEDIDQDLTDELNKQYELTGSFKDPKKLGSNSPVFQSRMKKERCVCLRRTGVVLVKLVNLAIFALVVVLFCMIAKIHLFRDV
jgi:hypothetical protein